MGQQVAVAIQNQDVAQVLRLQKLGWRIVLLPSERNVREISKWLSQTFGYRARDLNPYTFEYDGRWDGGEIDKPFDGYIWWIAFRDEHDYLMFQLKFSS